MPEPKPKKRNCPICDTEHSVGEACPTCEWDQEAEERKARGQIERDKIRESMSKPGKPKKGFWD